MEGMSEGGTGEGEGDGEGEGLCDEEPTMFDGTSSLVYEPSRSS